MDSHLVLGLPPTYIKQTDPSTAKGYVGGRAYRSLWGTVDSGRRKIVETKLYPVKITVGSPEKTKIGLMDTILNTIKDDESIEERIRIIKEDLEKKSQSGLNTFKFGSALRNGKNAYLETVNALMEMLAYGEKVQGEEDTNNYFLSRDFTYLNNFREEYDYPTITILASEETTITETATSEVGESLIKKVVDIGRESAREYNFLTGGQGLNLNDVNKFGDDVGGLAGSAIKLGAEAAATIEKTATTILGDDVVQALLKGNQIMLPTVWKKSAFTKKYTIHFRLHTPYGSKKAIQRNILVPLMYILGFSLPIQKTASSISYPYIIKVDSEGAFNIPMGIVTNLSLKKGVIAPLTV